MQYHNILEEPFEIYGLAVAEEGRFWRLPVELHDKVNDGVTWLSKNTAGARVRFATDSGHICVKYTLTNGGIMNHMPLTGMSGVDCLYRNADGYYSYGGDAAPGDANAVEVEGNFWGYVTESGKFRTVTLHLPLYNGITHMEIAVEDGKRLEKPAKYTIEKPICFYGSSITQGGCASRPSNAYTSLIGAQLDADHINLGFSGNGKGEANVAEYIASLELSAFVMDYDHNAPDADHLRATHEKFFRIIREKQPLLPVVFVSKPDFDSNQPENLLRESIIRETYENALKNGDRNVYFVPGSSLFEAEWRSQCTVDGCHPNDLGMWRMARQIGYAVKVALGIYPKNVR